MSMAGAEFDYKFGSKNNWRRWMWNRVMDRMDVPAKEAVVVYLAGRSDYDRELATSHGFMPNNLIAVESNTECCAVLRKKKRIVVDGELFDVLRSWNKERTVNVVIADLCSGMTHKVLSDAVKVIMLRPFSHTVFVFNMLRGRDASSNDIRLFRNSHGLAGLDKYQECLILKIMELGFSRKEAEYKYHSSRDDFWEKAEKHRGYHALDYIISWHLQLLTDQIVIDDFGNLCRRPGLVERGERTVEEVLGWRLRDTILNLTMPVTNSYRSTAGNQIFDTLIYKNAFGVLVHDNPATSAFSSACNRLHDKLSCRQTSRKISAVLAHRTMRMREA